jgi:hypothetical protein
MVTCLNGFLSSILKWKRRKKKKTDVLWTTDDDDDEQKQEQSESKCQTFKKCFKEERGEHQYL